MAEASLTPPLRRPAGKPFLIALAVLLGLLALLFSKSFRPELVLFSNDAPLGIISADSGRQASTIEGLFTGYWQDLNWLGIEQPAILPSISFWLYQIFRDPVVNAKFYGPCSLLVLGLSAWLFFRQLGFRNTVSVLGGVAAALNMDTFSNVCWGLPSRALAQGSIFLALAALQSGTLRHFWIKAVLGGMAVGMAVMEGFDVGALYSLYVAAFAAFLVLAGSEPAGRKIGRAIAFLAIISICAGWLAAHALNTLIGTQIKGVASAQQDEATKEKRWNEATYWSLPPVETLRTIIPGLFGYRMDTAEGGNYWGRVGEQPGLPRHSGSGEYAGVLVALIGVYTVVNGFRKKGGPFTDLERKHILFWFGAAIVSLLLAWGRHAPFYRIIYALPYFSTIRNPIKFMHMFHLALLTLFAFGLDGLYRHYIDRANSSAGGLVGTIKAWWEKAPAFDRRWIMGAAAGGILAILGFLVYYSSNRDLGEHLKAAGFPATLAAQIANFSYKETALFVLFYILSFILILSIQSGFFAGARWKAATLLVAGVIIVDLARANQNWIVYYDYKTKYQKLPVFDVLEKNAFEHRVTSKLSPFSGKYLVNEQDQNVAWFAGLENSWLQNQFQFYNIPSLEIIQLPRVPELDESFIKNFMPTNNNQLYLFPRLWELTSTRLLMGQRGYIESLGGAMGEKAGFKLQTPIGIAPRQSFNSSEKLGEDDITTDFNPQAPFGLYEFTNALPRVKLFTAWETQANDQKTLEQLRDPAFNPSGKVLVAEAVSGGANATNTVAASAAYIKYSPKVFSVKAESAAPGILLVNDKYSPNWKVIVDGKEDRLLRCNYIMRGVFLPAGSHTVEFRYRPPVNSLYVTLSAMAVALALLILLFVQARKGASVSVPAV